MTELLLVARMAQNGNGNDTVFKKELKISVQKRIDAASALYTFVHFLTTEITKFEV